MSPGGPRGQMTSIFSAAVGSSPVLAWTAGCIRGSLKCHGSALPGGVCRPEKAVAALGISFSSYSGNPVK